MRLILSIAFSLCVGFTSCRKDEINPGDDPNFTIVAHEDEGFNNFNRKVVVFGIPIYAKKRVEDDRLLHAANILAQYLDNNEDGVVDHQLVLDAMLEVNAFMVMWKNQSDLIFMSPPNDMVDQHPANMFKSLVWDKCKNMPILYLEELSRLYPRYKYLFEQ